MEGKTMKEMERDMRARHAHMMDETVRANMDAMRHTEAGQNRQALRRALVAMADMRKRMGR